jgi:hypothetical protein
MITAMMMMEVIVSRVCVTLIQSYLNERITTNALLRSKTVRLGFGDDPLRRGGSRHAKCMLLCGHETSHVTRVMSHVTHHLSRIIHHTSHITHHTSHITHHTSHITHHASRITHHTSCRCKALASAASKHLATQGPRQVRQRHSVRCCSTKQTQEKHQITRGAGLGTISDLHRDRQS